MRTRMNQFGGDLVTGGLKRGSSKGRRGTVSTAVALLVLLTAGLVVAPAAQATSPTSFALVCRLNSHAVARVDLSGFDVSRSGTKVDATSILWRSLAGDGRAQAGWTPDVVQIGLQYRTSITGMVDNNDETWTARGGTAHDGATYPSRKAWDPNGHYNAGHVHGRIYLFVQSLGGDACVSPLVAIS